MRQIIVAGVVVAAMVSAAMVGYLVGIGQNSDGYVGYHRGYLDGYAVGHGEMLYQRLESRSLDAVLRTIDKTCTKKGGPS